MQVSGSYVYPATPERVYETFTDRNALLQATPGLQSLEEIAPDEYRAVLKVGVGGFSLVYTGTLTVTERVPGAGYRLLIDAVTHNGYGRGEARFRFLPEAGEQTRAEYAADVELGGAQKLLPSLARMLVEYFLRGMDEVLRGSEESLG